MAKVYGVGYPERHLMAVLSDLLAIPHFTTSNGSTVRRDFLETVAGALGVPNPAVIDTKDGVLAACIEAATRQPMNPALYSPGATVTDLALQTMIDGIATNGLAGGLAGGGGGAPGGTAPGGGVVGPDLTWPADPGAPDDLPLGDAALALPLTSLEDLLDPNHELAPDARRLMAVAYREGQDAFRTAVLDAYGERCAITGWRPAQAIDAAHLVSHAEGGLSIVSNGIALRSDLHRLFDRALIAIHETALEVLVHPVLEPTEYAELAGKKIRVPKDVTLRPAAAALKHRREAAGL